MIFISFPGNEKQMDNSVSDYENGNHLILNFGMSFKNITMRIFENTRIVQIEIKAQPCASLLRLRVLKRIYPFCAFHVLK
jgi:hypothetical protein